MTESLPELTKLGIGKVLDELKEEFPELTISKIRYLEEEDLLAPERTPSGYRKFSYADVERLRFILRQQRDQFWPLSHIRQVLDEMDRGEVPRGDHGPARVAHLSLAPDGMPEAAAFTEPRSNQRLSRDDVLSSTGIDPAVLDEIEDFGLIDRRPSQTYYDADDLAVAAIVAELSQLGLEPRHLRGFKSAADREASLFDQVVSPRTRRDEPDAASATIAGLAAASVRLHAILVRQRLRG